MTVFGPKGAPTSTFSLPTFKNFFYKSAVFLFPSWRLTWHLIFKPYDIIHVVSPPAFFTRWVLFFTKKKKVKMVFSNHVNLDRYNKAYVKNRFLRFVNHQFCLLFIYGPQVKSKALLLHPEGFEDFKIAYPHAKTDIFPSGINTEAFSFYPKITPFHLVCIGRLAPEKNLFKLIDLFSLLPDRYHLTLVGDGPLEEELNHYIHSKGLLRVSFAGKIAHSQIPPFYQKAQAFLMTSLSETFGLTLLESLSCGTPIVYPQCPLFTRLYEKDFPEQQFDLEHPDSFILTLTLNFTSSYK